MTNSELFMDIIGDRCCTDIIVIRRVGDGNTQMLSQIIGLSYLCRVVLLQSLKFNSKYYSESCCKLLYYHIYVRSRHYLRVCTIKCLSQRLSATQQKQGSNFCSRGINRSNRSSIDFLSQLSWTRNSSL